MKDDVVAHQSFPSLAHVEVLPSLALSILRYNAPSSTIVTGSAAQTFIGSARRPEDDMHLDILLLCS